MKKVLFGLLAIVSVSSSATSLHPDTFVPESVTITKAEIFDNRMPTILPHINRPQTTLTVDVTSSGCTRGEDFVVNVESLEGIQFIEVVRIRPDRCKMVQHTVSVQVRSQELEGDRPIKVRNPLLVDFMVVH